MNNRTGDNVAIFRITQVPYLSQWMIELYSMHISNSLLLCHSYFHQKLKCYYFLSSLFFQTLNCSSILPKLRHVLLVTKSLWHPATKIHLLIKYSDYWMHYLLHLPNIFALSSNFRTCLILTVGEFFEAHSSVVSSCWLLLS